MAPDSLSYFLRHGQTTLSATHIVNGDRTVSVPLDEVGQRQCAAVRDDAWMDTVGVCVTSRFARTTQTADLVLKERRPRRVVEPRLDEIDYGSFEGGPWRSYGRWLTTTGRHVRPPGAAESLHEATQRLGTGLAAVLDLPGPRLVIGHGLMVSMLHHLQNNHCGLEDHLAEAPYVSPLRIDDDELRVIIDVMLNHAHSTAAGAGSSNPLSHWTA